MSAGGYFEENFFSVGRGVNWCYFWCVCFCSGLDPGGWLAGSWCFRVFVISVG